VGIFAGVTTWGWGRPSSGKQISSNIMKYLMQLPGSLAKVVNPMAGSRLRLQVPPDLECPGHLGSPAIAVATAIVGSRAAPIVVPPLDHQVVIKRLGNPSKIMGKHVKMPCTLVFQLVFQCISIAIFHSFSFYHLQL
jgi:hypothetical protein